MRATELLLVIALTGAIGARAQDPQFSQFYAAPQYLNPAFIGDIHQHRAVLNHRVQWPGVLPGYRTTMAAYDHRFSQMNAGIGGFVLHDKAGTSGIAHTTVAAGYSYSFRLNYKRSMRGALRVGYTTRGVDPNNFLFTDQLIRDQAPTSVETGIIQRIGYVDLAAGGLYHTEQFWAGVGIDHLNRPDQSLMTGGEAHLPVRTSVHAGHRFAMDGAPLTKSQSSFTAAMHYKMQGNWDQLDMGVYAEHSALTVGLWYRGLPLVKQYAPGDANNEALIALVGYDTGSGLRIAYSFDFTLSKLTMRSGGAHEISLVHEWSARDKPRKRSIIPCPKF